MRLNQFQNGYIKIPEAIKVNSASLAFLYLTESISISKKQIQTT